jgi:hypothetical protein
MPRNRIISAAESLYVGPTPSTGAHYRNGATLSLVSGVGFTNLVNELFRVQDCGYSFSFSNEPVSQFGDLAPIDYVTNQPPTVNLNFSYVLSNFINEKSLGFTLSSGSSQVGCLSGILTKVSDDKNYFLEINSEGQDAHQTNPTQSNVVGIGNGYISNYSLDASVGSFPTVSVDVEGLNMIIYGAGAYNSIPAINPTNGTQISNVFFELPTGFTNLTGAATNSNSQTISVLRPGDITFNLGYTDLGASTTDWKVQSVSLSIPMSRESIDQLGSRYAFSKELQTPITATLSVNAVVGDFVTGDIYNLFYNCGTDRYNGHLIFKSPCDTTTQIAGYLFRGMELVSQEYSTSVGSNKTISATFNVPIGGPLATGSNILMSGVSYFK